jgi:hypothetical protein
MGTMTIPSLNPSVAQTPTGFVLTPQGESTPIFFKRANLAKLELSRRDLGPQHAVFVAEDERDRLEDFGDAKAKATVAVCEVYGRRAVELIAARTHRLATTEEIARFKSEQQLRDEMCTSIEDNRPENRKSAMIATAMQSLASIAVTQQQAAAEPERRALKHSPKEGNN